jgi:hypothetical protein
MTHGFISFDPASAVGRSYSFLFDLNKGDAQGPPLTRISGSGQPSCRRVASETHLSLQRIGSAGDEKRKSLGELTHRLRANRAPESG